MGTTIIHLSYHFTFGFIFNTNFGLNPLILESSLFLLQSYKNSFTIIKKK